MEDQSPDSIHFHYVKSNSFKVVHCDGVWGGTTPRGYITMSVYSERAPIPQRLTLEVTSTGRIGEEVHRNSKEGIVREVDVEIIMDLDMARSMAEWLRDHVDFLEKQRDRSAGGDHV